MKQTDTFIQVSIDHEEGDKECDHDFLTSELLFVKRCQKCGKIEDYEPKR